MKGKLMGIDYGTKRVGIALSDDRGHIAFPQAVLENDDNLIENVITLCKAELIGGVVLGESYNNSMEHNTVMKEIEKFKGSLEKALALPIDYQPEFMTSHHAAQEKSNQETLDASAAALILQRYLDRHNE